MDALDAAYRQVRGPDRDPFDPPFIQQQAEQLADGALGVKDLMAYATQQSPDGFHPHLLDDYSGHTLLYLTERIHARTTDGYDLDDRPTGARYINVEGRPYSPEVAVGYEQLIEEADDDRTEVKETARGWQKVLTDVPEDTDPGTVAAAAGAAGAHLTAHTDRAGDVTEYAVEIEGDTYAASDVVASDGPVLDAGHNGVIPLQQMATRIEEPRTRDASWATASL